jgi:hypothetical protein
MYSSEFSLADNPVSVTGMSGFPEANPHEARKLGLLRKQKFRSRAGANAAAGAK